MLPYYSPFKVAEQFAMLEALFPGRIDIGVGRAPGGDKRTAQAVAAGDYNRGEIFPQQVADLLGVLHGTLASDHIAHGVLLQPQIATRPQVWMLGSSEFGGQLAARLGIPFSFAHFINPHFGQQVARAYRERFQPGDANARPYLAAAVFVICADSQREADDLEKAVDLRRVQMAYGLNEPIPTIEQGIAQEYGPREQLVIEREKPRSIIGTPETVTARLHALQEQFQADELIVLTVAGSYRARTRSYELLAEAFQLGANNTPS
jgi:luciferase family oxidoreductase group 1